MTGLRGGEGRLTRRGGGSAHRSQTHRVQLQAAPPSTHYTGVSVLGTALAGQHELDNNRKENPLECCLILPKEEAPGEPLCKTSGWHVDASILS